MIRSEFYNITDPPNKLNKTFENPVVIDGKFYETFDDLRPKLQIRWSNAPFNFNYCIVDGTAYFIEKVARETNTVITVNLLLDVLQTYKTKLLAAIGTIVSRENANKYISSRQNVYDVRPQIEKINFSVDAPFNENGTIIMVTLKGN